MAYTGPRVVCGRCGQSFARPADRRRHLAERRCSGRSGQSRAIVLARAEPSRAEVIDVSPTKSEIVPATRPVAHAGPVSVKSEVEPDWFVRKFPQDATKVPWRKRDEESRAYYERAHLAMARSAVSLPRQPDEADAATLWEQYHFLKALAVRLDAVRGAERDREMFEAGLREYDSNFDRIRAQRKALPG